MQPSCHILLCIWPGSLDGIFSQILGEDESVREKAIKFLGAKIKTLPEDTFDSQSEELLINMCKKVRPTFKNWLCLLKVFKVKLKIFKQYLYMYCGIILIRGSHCSWIVKISLVLGDVHSWVTSECKTIHYFVLNISRTINSLVMITHEIHKYWSLTNNDDSTLLVILSISFSLSLKLLF